MHGHASLYTPYCWLLCLLLALATSGCATETAEDPNLPSIEEMASSDGPWTTHIIGMPYGMTRRDLVFSEYYGRWMSLNANYFDAVYGAEDWMAAVDSAETFRAALPPEKTALIPSVLLDQAFALALLNHASIEKYFDEDDVWTDDALAKLAEAVTLLLDAGNPQSQRLLPALKRLQGYWSDEEVGRACSRLRGVTARWISEDALDPEVTIRRTMGKTGSAVILQMERAMKELEDMSGS